jgi:hypothetical protein
VKTSATMSKSETRQRVDQRRERRRAAVGEVIFHFGETPKEVRARLIDRSATGFRAEHDSSDLACGQMVEFRFRACPKRIARVVWTRIAGGRVETGFLILPDLR